MEFGAIYGQALDQSGNKLWGTEVRVDSDTELQQQSSPTVAANQDGSILLLERRPLQRTACAQKLDSNGRRLWATATCLGANSGDYVPGCKTDISSDENGHAFITSEQDSGMFSPRG